MQRVYEGDGSELKIWATFGIIRLFLTTLVPIEAALISPQAVWLVLADRYTYNI